MIKLNFKLLLLILPILAISCRQDISISPGLYVAENSPLIHGIEINTKSDSVKMYYVVNDSGQISLEHFRMAQLVKRNGTWMLGKIQSDYLLPDNAEIEIYPSENKIEVDCAELSNVFTGKPIGCLNDRISFVRTK